VSKLTIQQRQQVKEWIKFCRIRGMSLQATIQVVNKELPEGCSLSMSGLQRYIGLVKRESQNWMDTLALNLYEFISELKQRWDSLHELNRTQWEALDDARKQGDIDNQIKAAATLSKINDQILQMLMLLPTVKSPSSLSLQERQQMQAPPYPFEPEPLGPSPLQRSEPEPTEMDNNDGPIL
jgi:hypothetical protein